MMNSDARWASLFCISLGALCAGLAYADDRTTQVEAFLQEFNANPAAVMKRPFQKFDAQGEPVSPALTEAARSQRDVEVRDSLRQGFCKTVDGTRVCLKDVAPGRAPIERSDRAEDLVDNGRRMLRTLNEIQQHRLTRARLAESPWSDDYWGLYKGVLAARYADPQFPSDADWKRNKAYTDEVGFMNIIASGNSTSVDALSPAEKYDLLVGDQNGSLTAAMWRQGEGYYHRDGSVESWMGICHGWSPASYMLPRPTHAITVMAADGRTKIRFYPSDIKALGSLLWAQTKPDTNFIGGRCKEKSPPTDANGRIQSQDCFDTNPGTWHMAMVNQIGVSRRSMVMDATYDYEVWNQPVYSYSYTYFNPETDKEGSLAASTVAIGDFKHDKFSRYRSRDAVSVVGIAMDATYVVETNPSHATTDSPSNDALKTVRLVYDLELDRDGEIIGGEWYANAHPDFLWTPSPRTRARSIGDRFLRGDWNGDAPVPEAWSRAAAHASQEGQPLAKVVEALFVLSRLPR